MPARAREPDVPDGLVSGRAHVVRLRSQILELARERGTLTRRQRTTGAAAVASCDPARVDALSRVPTTSRADDAAEACVVLPVARSPQPAPRLLLGTAQLTGDGIREVQVRRKSKGDEIVVRLTTKATELQTPATDVDAPAAGFTPPRWRVDVDGEIVGTVISGRSPAFDPSIGAQLVISGPGIRGKTTNAIAAAIDQARSEQIIELAGQAAMTRDARKLLSATTARVEDKSQFVIDCPVPEASGTLVLGCYDGRIFVLRVDRPDLAGVMTVTAAHEMLHAAYEDMPRAERRRIVEQLNAFMEETGDARIQELLVEYDRLQPGSRDNELHSLVGTQLRELPRPLERHYRQFFTDRSAIVDAFDAYQKVFDDLQARYDQLAAEAQALEAQLNGARAELDAAAAEADRLFSQIESLRNQGRIDESNNLVGAQNAAVARANALVGSFNALVDQYNARAFELNALAITLNDTYNAISPIPIEPPPAA